jgi:hypothetical protein
MAAVTCTVDNLGDSLIEVVVIIFIYTRNGGRDHSLFKVSGGSLLHAVIYTTKLPLKKNGPGED